MNKLLIVGVLIMGIFSTNFAIGESSQENPIEKIGIDDANKIAKNDKDKDKTISANVAKKLKDMTPAQRNALRKETAIRFKKAYFQAGAVTPTLLPGPDGLLIPDYFGIYPNYANSPYPVVNADGTVSGGIRKFVDSLPGLGPDNKNNLQQYLPVAVPDNVSFTDADYYEIALVEYEEQMHTDLPPTKLRGYVQLDTDKIPGNGIPLNDTNGNPIYMPDGVTQAIGVDKPHYLGPTIIAQKGHPVRIKFSNLLPIGQGGDLFIPVDTTIMGAGMGPVVDEMYTQNRATLHLHGGRTPWISDGTTHQWITPANETTSYPKGVSAVNVPDMTDPGNGSMTFYYTNNQSARLMFYHDHSYGITRVNVYAGEAAGYILQDPVEEELVNGGIIPAEQIPLIIQDKTFVPDSTTPYTNIFGTFSNQLEAQDPTWNRTMWGDYGDLWYPHVYMQMQNPWDPSGMAPMGRWHYGPWFWPPTTNIKYPPIPNPYYQPDPNLPNYAPWEPPYMPATPNPSISAEAFMDTPVINGAAYPYIEVDPKAYRFRILNAADDRFWNLQLYEADTNGYMRNGIPTEVKMLPAVAPDACNPDAQAFPAKWPTDGRPGGVPDPATRGPPIIQIGSEGGFLPGPVVIQSQPIDWNRDMGTFDFGNVNTYGLFLAPAERADVVVDFSQFKGKTLILYNDAPAPVPANDPRLDYYTGGPDQSDIGGANTTLPGYGPNTRTIMQIRVRDLDPTPYDVVALENAFKSTATQEGAFARSQTEIIVPQAAYNLAYNDAFPDVFGNIDSTELRFTPLGATQPVTIPMKAKAIQDEMGETFDKEYGRMAAMLGLELPKTQALMQTTLLYGFADPPTEIIKPSITGTQIGSLEDGTQIWKITQNGVDTHPLHWHMFEVQVINRVAWDNNIRMTDLNELGWKETVRINPLQDTIIALRPIIPDIPFELPNNIRLLDPTKAEGVALKVTDEIFDPSGEPITLTNHKVNFGWEFALHCHILAHEENDMMRPVSLVVAPKEPSNLTLTLKLTGKPRVTLNWNDTSVSETHWTIQRGINGVDWTTIDTIPSTTGPTTGTPGSYNDNKINSGSTYYYRVLATNIVGDTTVYPAPAIGFPTMSADSGPSNVENVTV